jgi:hypothetical protein
MDPVIIAAVIGGIFGVVIAPIVDQVLIPFIRMKFSIPRGGGIKPVRPHRKPWIIFLQAAIGGVIGVLLGYFLVSSLVLSPCRPFAPTSVTITFPVESSKVPLLATFQGDACNIPQDKELWLLVVPEGMTSYFPQPGPVVVSSDGKWTAIAYIGQNNPVDVEKGFVVYVALADQKGSASIRAYFTSGYKPLEPLPEGIQLIRQVRVVRT